MIKFIKSYIFDKVPPDQAKRGSVDHTILRREKEDILVRLVKRSRMMVTVEWAECLS